MIGAVRFGGAVPLSVPDKSKPVGKGALTSPFDLKIHEAPGEAPARKKRNVRTGPDSRTLKQQSIQRPFRVNYSERIFHFPELKQQHPTLASIPHLHVSRRIFGKQAAISFNILYTGKVLPQMEARYPSSINPTGVTYHDDETGHRNYIDQYGQKIYIHKDTGLHFRKNEYGQHVVAGPDAGKGPVNYVPQDWKMHITRTDGEPIYDGHGPFRLDSLRDIKHAIPTSGRRPAFVHIVLYNEKERLGTNPVSLSLRTIMKHLND